MFLAGSDGLITITPARSKPPACIYPPKLTLDALDGIAEKKVETVYLNPGTESDEVVKKAEQLGLNTIQACSIVAVGSFPD
jgi:predicted CoA-binding protein